MSEQSRRRAIFTIAVVMMTAISGCSGSVVDYKGPSQVVIFNNTDEPQTFKIQVFSDGESYVDSRKSIPANDSLTFGVQLPGRKVFGERYYNVSVDIDNGENTTESLKYNGANSILVIIEDDGSIRIAGLIAG